MRKGEKKMSNIPYIDMEATGKNITHLREEAGLSVNQLQERLCYTSTQAIYKWQRGASMPSLDNLVALASILEVRVDDILVTTGTERKEENVR